MAAIWSGIRETVAALHALNERVDAASRVATVQVGAEVEKAAKGNFEGAHRRNEPRVPNSSNKPNIVTGTLRRSIRSTGVVKLAGGWTTTVGPTAVYGRRVELGFSGRDSLGRQYNQPAYPYFGPGVKEVRLRVGEISTRNWAVAIGG
jgi:hypothetical protein